MSDTISTFLLFEDDPDRPLQAILEPAIERGWQLGRAISKDEYTYGVGDEYRSASAVEDVIDEVDEAETGDFRLEIGDLEVYVKKNDPHIPVSDVRETEFIPNVYIWADQYDISHRRDARTQIEARRNVEKYLELVALAAEQTNPDYGCGAWGSAFSPTQIPARDELADPRIAEIFWLNLFLASTADGLGYDRLFTAPAWRVEEIDTGHVLLVAADNPYQRAEEWEGAEERIAEHLGIDT